MFFPFIGAASVAIAFTQLGAVSTKVAVLTGSLYAVILVAIAPPLSSPSACLLPSTSGLEEAVRKVEYRLGVFTRPTQTQLPHQHGTAHWIGLVVAAHG